MNVKKWFDKRGPRFILQRASSLLNRYRLTPAVAMSRIEDSLSPLAHHGLSPTFFVPGIIVKRYSRFIHSLQSRGAEIAVHSYQHIDLNSIPVEGAKEQLNKALEVFNVTGLDNHGFRCPYLSHSDELLESIPKGLFGYSSNKSIWVEPTMKSQNNAHNIIYDSLKRFYNPRSFTENLSMPHSRSNMVEIPVCVPDDLQLHDGLNLEADGISHAWIVALDQTHRRGELFNLIFHPELGSLCKDSFEDLLRAAEQYKPVVWIARLRDISAWWKEKSAFSVDICSTATNLILNFSCSPRATILLRGTEQINPAEPWQERYYRLNSRSVELPLHPRPFIGLAPGIPEQIVSLLREQGYILDQGDTASDCVVHIDDEILRKFSTQVELIDYIEGSVGPLVRFWRWPDGARSALSITGDLDALTLVDYATRLTTM